MNITATVSKPSVLAFLENAAYLALAVDSPLKAYFRFSIDLTGFYPQPAMRSAKSSRMPVLIIVFMFLRLGLFMY